MVNMAHSETEVVASTSAPPQSFQPTSTPSQASSIRVSRCTSTADLEAVSEIELLSFPGTNAADRLSTLLHPFRPALIRTGVSPRHWPDFQTTVLRNWKALLAGRNVLIKAEIDVDTQTPKVVGMALISLPTEAAAAGRARRTWKEKLLGDYVYPAVDGVRTRVWSTASTDGTDMRFMKVYKEEVARRRLEVMADREYFSM